MPLSKEEQEQLDKLTAKRDAPPERNESIGVNFTYDPDDRESVKRGFTRGHLTAEDLTSWGYDLKELGLKVAGDGGDGDDGDDGGGDGGDGERTPQRKGYFGS